MKNISQFLLFLFFPMLASCVVPLYSTFDGYSYIQRFQKRETIGHTDPVQRKKDFFDCGVIQYSGGALDLTVKYPGMNDEDVTSRMQRIYACIKNKGYIVPAAQYCTENGKPTGYCDPEPCYHSGFRGLHRPRKPISHWCD